MADLWLLPVDDEEEQPGPETLAEWYEQLVEAAADGNAPPFEWERDRIIYLAKQELMLK